MKNIVVLGNGLDGLLAAYATALHFGDTGYRIAMLAPGDGLHVALDVPSVHDYVGDQIPFEALGLNAELAGLLQTRQLETSAIGRPQDWSAKVGCRADLIGQDFSEGVQTVRSAQSVIMALAPLARQIVTGWNMHEIGLDQRLAELEPDFAINTMDRGMVCRQPDDHRFLRRQFFTGVQGPPLPANNRILNSAHDLAFYMRVNFNGVVLSYWVDKPPLSNIEVHWAPVSTNCDCWPDFLHVGPEATFDNSQTYDDVFRQVTEQLKEIA